MRCLLLVLFLTACTPLEMPPTWKCHAAIRYANYQRHACVVYTI
jgi:hypothetical protein